jgi:hypothetical protein
MSTDAPLSSLAEALFFQRLDTGPGITPRPPSNVAEPTQQEWLEELLRSVERRAERKLAQSRRKPRKGEADVQPRAQSVLDLCGAVRIACTIRDTASAATAAIMAVSQLWVLEHADALKANARKGAHAASEKKPIARIKPDVKRFWYEYFFLQKHRKKPRDVDFAMEAQRRWSKELDKSDRVLPRWSREWRKELRALAGIAPKK